jgi:hypothetical protein
MKVDEPCAWNAEGAQNALVVDLDLQLSVEIAYMLVDPSRACATDHQVFALQQHQLGMQRPAGDFEMAAQI